jgi:hypothetical protein
MSARLSQGIAVIRQRWPGARPETTDEPVFVLAAGWRSGSTLLQRMLLKHCMVWGEPYEPHGLIDRLAQPLCFFWEDWPPNDFFINHPQWGGKLGDKWAANLYPPIESLLEAHVAFLRHLFAEPARERGYERWGLKAVRYGVEQAIFLHWLFPRARFLFLVRNPYDCWSSYRRAGSAVVRFYPEEQIRTPEQFGRHWLELATCFHEQHAKVGGRLLRYDNLTSQAFDSQSLEEYLGFKLDLSVRDTRLGASPRGTVAADEFARLHQVIGKFADGFGYPSPVVSPPSPSSGDTGYVD